MTDVQVKLQATGKFSSVDTFDVSSSTPSLTQLQQYSSVLVFSDLTFADANTLGDNLDAYLRAGGGVVTAVFTGDSVFSLSGAFATNGDSPVSLASIDSGTELT